MSQDDHMIASAPLQMLGRYRILHLIGKGAMGDVWLADDPRLQRQVAVKTLPMHNQHDQEFSLRFLHEAQAAAALNHPHIVPIHDFGEQSLPNGQSIMYLVMPYVTEGSLADKIWAYASREMLMPPLEAVGYLRQAAEAIDYAHSKGVIHRDVKPGNMLLRPGNWLLLGDFGIARMLSNPQPLTQAGVGIGTPEYMAPEQAQGRAEAASDNYSLAVVAYQLFTGRLPFSAETGYAMTMQHLTVPPPSPIMYNPSLPLEFAEIILRGLAKNAQQRPSSASAFVAALEHSLTEMLHGATPIVPQLSTTLAVSTHLPDGQVTRVSQPKKQQLLTRRRVLIGAGAGILLAATAGVLGYPYTTQKSSPHLQKISTLQTQNTVGSHDPVSSLPGSLDALFTLQAHNKPVLSLRWSPAAPQVLASAGPSGDSQVFLWNIAAFAQQKGQTVSAQQSVQRQQFELSSDLLLAWSPDGNSLAIGNTHADIGTNTIALSVYKSDLATPAPGFEQPFTMNGLEIRALGWLHEHDIVTIVDSGVGGPTLLGLLDTTRPTQHFTPATISDQLSLDGGLANPRLLAVANDGSRLALGLDQGAFVGDAHVEGTRVVWQQLTDILKFKPTGLVNMADDLAWSHDGHFVIGLNEGVAASGGIAGSPPKVVQWDWRKKQDANQDPPSLVVPDTTTQLTTLALTSLPNNGLIAAGNKKGSVYVWDVNTNGTTPLYTLNGIAAEVTALAWSADGQWLAGSYNDAQASILLWKIKEG